MVRVARGAGLDDQVDRAAQAGADQVLVHRAGGEQRMQHDLPAARAAVGQDQQQHALARGGLGLRADVLDGGTDAGVGIEGEFDVAVGTVVGRHRQQLAQLALRQHRRIEVDVAHGLGAVGEHIALAPELGRQRHHAVFAQRIDRRIGDLREGLAEAVVQRPHLLRQRGHRHVVAHRADRFLLGFGQRAQHLLALLAGELEQFLETGQGQRIERGIGEAGIDQLGMQVLHALLEPALVRRARAVDRVDRLAVEQRVFLQVGGDHLPGAELALAQDLRHRHVPHPGFRGDQEMPVAGQLPARRAQAVAVQRAGGVAAVEQHDPGRTVPGLAVERVVLVERGEVGVLVFQRLRGRRHQDAHRLQRVHAAGFEQVEHRVQRLRIRTVDLDHRLEFARIEVFAAPHMRARLRPRTVAGDGIDLAVVGEHAERLRQRPARGGVGGEALVEHRHAGFQFGALQVGIQLRQPRRQHHALVADAVGGQGHAVERRQVLQALGRAAAGEVERAAEGVRRGARAFDVDQRRDEHLLDARHRGAGGDAAGLGIDRHRAPAGDGQLHLSQCIAQGLAAARRFGFVIGEEHQPGGELRAEGEAGFLRQRAQEPFRLLEQQAAAVATQPVGGHATAMGHARQCFQRRIHGAARGFVVELRDQAEAAAVALVAGVIEALLVALRHGGSEARCTATWSEPRTKN